MNNTKRNELIDFVGKIYEASKTDLTLLLADMQPKEYANINEVNDLVENVRQNIVALRNAAMLCMDANKGFIKVRGEPLLKITSEAELDNVSTLLPKENHVDDRWLWVDKNGMIAAMGPDFKEATNRATYPITIYKLQRISEAKTTLVQAGI